ncbi:membrane-bound lytic murein transglycosylase D [Pseudomonas sp. LP_7_YM]|nr:membrane-bound lytic murein transglycosylase D [Pseudomonas sp. LP_7_YM]
MPPALTPPMGPMTFARQLRLGTLTLALLCAGCQSIDYQAFGYPPQPAVERTPRLIAGLNRSTEVIPDAHPPLAAVPYDGSDIWGRLGQGFSLVDDTGVNQRIVRQRDWLLGNPGFLRNASLRASPYLHFIAESLDQRGMPSELALLPIVESAYNPKANSIRDAAGLWQFMAATGRDFNLRQTAWYDGRRDVVASSKAAMDYLTRLHTQFNGDWLLAMAAYNAGEGTVSRAVEANRQRGMPTDYWHLNLPRETQDYVPRLLALSLLVREPETYGVQLNPVANAPYFTSIELTRAVDLSQLAASAGIDEAVLLGLNPAFLRKKTLDGPTHLLVPRDQARQLSASLAKLAPYAAPTAGEALAITTTPLSPSVRLVP